MKKYLEQLMVWMALLMLLPSGVCAQKATERVRHTAKPVTWRLNRMGRGVFNPTLNSLKTKTLPRKSMAKADGDGPVIYGLMPGEDDWEDWAIVSFSPSADMSLSEVFSDEDLEASGNAVYVNGEFYVTRMATQYGISTCTQTVFDATDWTKVRQYEVTYSQPNANCITYDKTTGQVFLIQSEPEGESTIYTFGRMNLTTGEVITISQLPSDENIGVLAASPDGKLYAININGMLETIDKNSGEITKIGHTDVKPAQILQSATFDNKTGIMYWAAFNDMYQSILYTVNTTTGHATKVGEIPDNVELISLFIPDEEPTGSAPAAPTNVAFDFEGESTSGNITFHSPATTVDGEGLSGTLNATVQVGGQNYTVTVEPDADCSVPVTVNLMGFDGLGEYFTANVSVSNDNGCSEIASAQQWIGPDNPAAMESVTLKKEGTKAVLTWTRPTKGKHGGYIDPSQVVFNLSCGSIWEENYTDTTYTYEITGSEIQSVMFRVLPIYKGHVGDWQTSNSVIFGEEYVAPCSFDFSDEFTFNQCSVIDANNDSYTWTNNFRGADISTMGTSADDWLVTPKVRLKGGQSYQLNVSTWARNPYVYTELVELRMGKGATADSLETIIDTLDISEKFGQTTVSVNVPEGGLYHFAFHCLSTDGMEVAVSSFSIDEEADLTAPDVVENLVVTPDSMGQLSATVTCNAPTKDINGNALSGNETVMILRGQQDDWGRLISDTIATFTDVEPGQAISTEDQVDTLGNYTYTVFAFNANGSKGKTTTQTVYIGVDVPDVATDVTLVEDNNNARLSWKAPTKGANGGYIDPEGLRYLVVEPGTGGVLAQDYQDTVYTTPLQIVPNYQYGLVLGIVSYNEAGSAPSGSLSNTLCVGNPYQLPMVENFKNGYPSYSWFLAGTVSDDEEDGWNTSWGEGYDEAYGFARYTAAFPDQSQSLVSGKISLSSAGEPHLHFKMLGFNSSDSLIVEIANDLNGTYVPVKSMCMKDYPAQEWQSIDIPLEDYLDEDYIHIAFHAIPKEYDCTIVLDNISIRDVLEDDPAIDKLTISGDETTVGKDSITVSARVINLGSAALEDGSYTVSFYAGDRLLESVEGKAIDYMKTAVLQTVYHPNVKDDDETQLYAVVNYSGDQDNSNNASDSLTAYVFKPLRPAVDDLKATVNGSNVVLTWSKPDQSGTPVQRVTDDFESYRPFLPNHFGQWTARDLDGKYPNANLIMSFPALFTPMGWDVFNTDDLSGTSYYWPAYSGSQCVGTLAPASGDNDDWLITPELSGNAQDVTFMALSGSEEYGHEMFRVYTSTTDTALASFQALDEEVRYVPSEWTEYSFSLPEGTKYFAVRCISHNRKAMLIDDFSYEECAYPLEVVFKGYNIYRNDEKLNTELLTEPRYETTAANGDKFYVEVVYDLGESDPSNVVTLVIDGINQLTSVDSQGSWYDISGRKVSRPTHRGIYVRKGKKVILNPTK
ncbi:MAG: choice-of-anchor J domain-containing protein [Prevotella sp.]|jgi:hypothetical protein